MKRDEKEKSMIAKRKVRGSGRKYIREKEDTIAKEKNKRKNMGK